MNFLKKIMEFVQSNDVISIPLTNDIWLDTQRLRIAGRMPRPKNSSDQDAGIIASLISFFRTEAAQDVSLIFCSENVQDFAIECEPIEKLRRFVVAPMIQRDLPDSRFFVDLMSALRFSEGYESFPIPDDEEIQHAIQLRDLHDYDSAEYATLTDSLEGVKNEKAVDLFEEQFIESLSNEYLQIRNDLGSAITQLLQQCRACPLWNDRSEYKLPQWIKFVPEEMLPYTSIPKMVRIKRSLEEYLKLHKTGKRSNTLLSWESFDEENHDENNYDDLI